MNSYGDIGRSAMPYTSMSAASKTKFEQYQQLFRDKCADAGIATPFELQTPEDVEAFLSDLSAAWAAKKEELGFN